jgi:MerR family transcriptional regulator, redox-sensitive transcriptional activator SoxR
MVRAKVGLMSNEFLAIGEVVRRSGKAASAIRYYETVGLIDEPARVSGRRQYPAEVVRTLAVIETAQRAGLTLDEIRLLLEASPEDPETVDRLRDVAAKRLPILDEAIARAELVRGWLESAADCCCPSLGDCPLFDEPARLPERNLRLA